MDKRSCYCEDEMIYYDPVSIISRKEIRACCNGTRERDECSCGGDRTKCDFYPEVREKALIEIKPKFGEWIKTQNKWPEKSGRYLCYIRNSINVEWYDKGKPYSEMLWKYEITHWMPLPEEPKVV